MIAKNLIAINEMPNIESTCFEKTVVLLVIHFPICFPQFITEQCIGGTDRERGPPHRTRIRAERSGKRGPRRRCAQDYKMYYRIIHGDHKTSNGARRSKLCFP